MQLQNIYNTKRFIYLFKRDTTGELHIETDASFYPYYYEKDDKGEFNTYDGKKVRKIVCNEPRDVGMQRSADSYEADILFPKRYIIDRIDQFDKSPTKYFFIDIEVLTKDMPDIKKAEFPISCISIYNSYHEDSSFNIVTFFLGDYKSENEMLNEFCNYIKQEAPDVILGWNINFDYTYLHNRIPDFARKISPINRIRYGDNRDVFYPAGISILDYSGNKAKAGLFSKVYQQERAYSLDLIAEKYLGKGKSYKHIDFSTLNEEIKKRNIEDVEIMIKLEKEKRIIDYFDEVRRSSMCLWEDVISNSRILDIIILKEAKKRNIILPNRRKKEEEKELEGAYRRADVGVFNNVYKADAGSMYPNQVINFCLDAQNIKSKPDVDTMLINNVHIKQDPKALLPSIAITLVNQKNVLKKQLKAMKQENKDTDLLKKKYDAIKSLVNSLYGVMAFPSFRLFNYTIASTITYLSRELLKYVEKGMKDKGYEVHYSDTDALIYSANEDKIDLLNQLVEDWAISNYENVDLDIKFDSEGMFTKLLILGKCHYFGYLKDKIKPEIKGMEIKRSSSSKFEADFQRKLIDKILDKTPKNDIIDWIKKEQERIKTLSLLDIAFPCKISNRKYVNEPIFVRAYNNTRLNIGKKFKINKGELFYYLYVNDMGVDENKKPINVIAISPKYDLTYGKELINWDEMKRRNIIMKVDAIFEVLGWGKIKDLTSNQLRLF